MIEANWPLQVSAESVKVVWRMTGDGDLIVGITDPHGVAHSLAWGPEPHGLSNFDRPGQEWGTGIVFDSAGCWHVALNRSASGSGDVWFDVSP